MFRKKVHTRKLIYLSYFLNFSSFSYVVSSDQILYVLAGLVKSSTTDLFITDLVTLLSKKNDDVCVELILHNVIHPSEFTNTAKLR